MTRAIEVTLDDLCGPESPYGESFFVEETRRLPAKPLVAEVLRPVEPADLVLLAVGRTMPAPTLQTIRDSHHHLAKHLAGGMSNVEASYVTGFSPGRISTLMKDPSFIELLDYYRTRIVEAFDRVNDRLATLSLDAVEELRQRLHEDPDSLRTDDLRKIAQMGLDRTGFGPTQSTVNKSVSVSLTSDDLKRMKKEADAEHKGKTEPSGRELAVGAVDPDGASGNKQGTEGLGITLEGLGI